MHRGASSEVNARRRIDSRQNQSIRVRSCLNKVGGIFKRPSVQQLRPAMAQTWWEGPRIPQRHRITRGAARGYHHLSYQRIGHHAVGAGCTRSLSNEPCVEYQRFKCPKGLNFAWTEELLQEDPRLGEGWECACGVLMVFR